MSPPRWNESMKSFWNHLDPEKDDQLKWIKIEVDTNVKRILKIVKGLNHGNKEAYAKKKTDLFHLIEDLHTQYQSLYALYDDLKGEVKNNIEGSGEGSSPVADSDSESYYSPDESSSRSGESNSKLHNKHDKKRKSLDLEDDILKDKLTSTDEVKNTVVEYLSSLSGVHEGEVIKDLSIASEQTRSTGQKLTDDSVWLNRQSLEEERSRNFKYKLDHINNLETQVASLKLKQETLHAHRRELEDQINHKASEAKQLGEENSALRVNVSELEKTFKASKDELSALQKKCEQNEKQSVSKIESLAAQIRNLQSKVNSLLNEKVKLEQKLVSVATESDQVKGLLGQVDVLQQELKLLSNQKKELELQLNRKSQEVAEHLVEIKILREKTRKTSPENRKTEKDGLKVQVKDLEIEVKSLNSQKSDLEEQIISINNEADHSRVEKGKLESKLAEKEFELASLRRRFEAVENEMSSQILSLNSQKSDLQEQIISLNSEADHLGVEKEKLEIKLAEKEDELASLRRRFEARENEISSQILSLTSQVYDLHHMSDVLKTEKCELELQIDRENQEFTYSLTEIKKLNEELRNQVADQEGEIKGLKNVIEKLNQEKKRVQGKFGNSKCNLQIAERKMEEMAADFRKQFEDNLRILSRRIKVAEQLHLENKEWYKKTKDSYVQESKDLRDKIAAHEVTLKKAKDYSKTTNEMLTSLDTVALKFDESGANYLNRISKVSCELKFAKDWLKRKNRLAKHANEEPGCSLGQLDDKEQEILEYREKVWKLENKVRDLEKAVKGKEDDILVAGEEKREAIRQLCVCIDYHRCHSHTM